MKTKFSAYLNSDLPPYKYEVFSDKETVEGVLQDILTAVGDGLLDVYEWEVTSYAKDYEASVMVEHLIRIEMGKRGEMSHDS